MKRVFKDFLIIVGLIIAGLASIAAYLNFTGSNSSQGVAIASSAPAESASTSKSTQSAWVPFGKGMYATSPIGGSGLDPTDPASLLLTTDSHTGMPMLLIMISPSPMCEVGGQDISGELNDAFTYYVNDKAIPFHGGCAVGKLLLKPSNPKAMEDFMGEFGHITQPIITITAPDGSTRRYMQQGFEAANIALLNEPKN